MSKPVASCPPGSNEWVEERVEQRKGVPIVIEFQSTGGPRFHGLARNLSLGGAWIETDSPARFGSELLVYMSLPGLPEPAAIRSVVRWSRPGAMGIQFGRIGERETQALMDVCDR